MKKGKVLVELDYFYEYPEEGTNSVTEVVLRHPDLKGILTFVASTDELADVQINHLTVKTEVSVDPLKNLIENSARLINGVNQLKDKLKK